MNKVILFLMLLLTSLTAAQAQETTTPNFCGTAPGKSPWLIKYQRERSSTLNTRSREIIYMPMTITILTNDDGSLGYSKHLVLDELCQLNEDFKDAGIYFFLNEPIRTLNNTLWNGHKKYEEAIELFENNIENTLNVYYATSAAGNCGYYWGAYDAVVLAKGCMGPTSHTWAHEMGHNLSLPHTFVGWEGEAYSFNLPTPAEINGWETELADKTNCLEAGDGFCDTPPDYISYRWTCNSQFTVSYDLKDANGKPFNVDGRYFMSYSNDLCMDRFSMEQQDAMRENCQQERTDWIVKSLDNAAITDTIVLRYPRGGETVKAEKVTLSWSKVNNATEYFYEVARDKNFNYSVARTTTQDTFVVLPNLLDGKSYFWRVRAYNLDYTCRLNNTIKRETFVTQSQASNTLDVKELSSMIVYPNPIESNQTLNITLNVKHSGTINLGLHDLNGRLLLAQNAFLYEGENELQMNIGDLPRGIYTLQVSTQNGSAQRKITIF